MKRVAYLALIAAFIVATNSFMMLNRPQPSSAAALRGMVKKTSGRVAKEVEPQKPVKKETHTGLQRASLSDGDALSDAEIKTYLEHTPNGEYLLPHFKAVGQACRKWNVNPKLLIGMFQMECNLGKRMIPAPRNGRLHTSNGLSNNYGNLRKNPQNFKASGTPPIGYIRIHGGPHAIFRTPADGINAYCWTLRHLYLDRGRDSLPKIVSVYAPKSDGNNPDKYVKVVGRYLRTTAK